MSGTLQPPEPPAALLAKLEKHPDLVPYGGGNFGMPLAMLNGGLIVPNDRFFVRSNGPVPEIDPARWRLLITGNVKRTVQLSLDDVKALPRRRLTAFLECAGNSRTRFDPVPEGTPWRNDAAGNAEWEGVALGDLLDLAGVRDDTVDVVSVGGDFAGMRRGLPLGAARDADTLVVWSMNGEALPVAHGGPVRLLVPGWAGIASTKWLVGLEVLNFAFDGFWNADNYVFWTEAGEPVRPVSQLPVKSIISAPDDGEIVPAGDRLVTGYAWSGYGAIRRVEISTDGGTSWAEACLETAGRRSWARFSHPWRATPGPARIQARATDERGLRQPATAEWNAKGYLMNGIHEVSVTVSD
ncbi:MAG: sulfite oxidase [Chloroflexota bacterium]|nr:sulfite oxidase [Chloroflexota bacterium]